MDSHIAHRAVGLQVVCTDHAGAALRGIGFDEIESLVVRRDLNAVRALDIGVCQNARELAGRIDSIYGHARHIREVQPALTVDGNVVGGLQRLALIGFGEGFHFPGFQIGARDARFPLH